MASDSFNAETVIDKPLQEVFEFVSNLENLPRWTDVVQVQTIKETPEKVGSQYNMVFNTWLSSTKVTVEIISYDSPVAFSFKDLSTEDQFDYHFLPVEGNTQIKLSSNSNGHFSSTPQKLQLLLAKLKAVLETQ